MQNQNQLTIMLPKSKPEIEVKYRGSLFSENGSSNMISNMD